MNIEASKVVGAGSALAYALLLTRELLSCRISISKGQAA